MLTGTVRKKFRRYRGAACDSVGMMLFWLVKKSEKFTKHHCVMRVLSLELRAFSQSKDVSAWSAPQSSVRRAEQGFNLPA